MFVWVWVCAHMDAQLRPTLCDLMDWGLPGSSVHGILQARILEWIPIFFLRGMFPSWQSHPHLLWLLHWQADSLPLSHLGSPHLLLSGNSRYFLTRTPTFSFCTGFHKWCSDSCILGKTENNSNLSRGTRPCSKHSTCSKASPPPTTTSLHNSCWSLYQLHFRDEDTGAQRGEATCQGSQS